MHQPLDFRARTVSEIVDASFQLFRRNATQYVLAVALSYLPFVVIQLALVGIPDPTDSAAATGISTMVGLVVAVLSYAVMSAVIIHFSAEEYLGRPADLATSFRTILPALPAVLVSSIVRATISAIGLVLLIFPGVYLYVRYFATTQVIVLEGGGVGQAFSRSSVLTKGRKRHVFNTLALLYLLFFVASLAVTMLAGVTQLFGETHVVVFVFSTIFTVVAYPIIGIADMMLYYDTRIRAEAYDVEVLAGGLTARSGETAAV